MRIESSAEFMEISQTEVAKYINRINIDTENPQITKDDVYCVWSCKILQNLKGLFATPLPDDLYFEITYNGDKGELYFDAYKKIENKVIR